MSDPGCTVELAFMKLLMASSLVALGGLGLLSLKDSPPLGTERNRKRRHATTRGWERSPRSSRPVPHPAHGSGARRPAMRIPP